MAHRPAEELFDILSDPENLRDLARNPVYDWVTASLRRQLDAYLASTGDPRAVGRGDVFESYPRLRGTMRTVPPPEWALPKSDATR